MIILARVYRRPVVLLAVAEGVKWLAGTGAGGIKEVAWCWVQAMVAKSASCGNILTNATNTTS